MDFQEVGWGDGLDQAGSGYGQVAGTCKCCNEPPGSIKCKEFLGQLRTRQLLKKDCSTEWWAWCDKRQPDTATEGPHCWPKWVATVVMKKVPLRKKSETYSQPQKPLYYTPISFITQYSIQKIAQLEWSSIPGTGRLFPPHHVQTRSGTHPVPYPKSTLGSYHNSKFSAVAIICEFLI